MIILSGAAPFWLSRKSRIMTSSAAFLSLGNGGGGTGSTCGNAFLPLYMHQPGRRTLPSDIGKGVIGPYTNNMRSFISCMNLNVHPHLLDVVAIGNDSKHDVDDVQDTSTSENYCYLLRSLDSDHPLRTYIGFTTNPPKRLRQHNGELTRGARRTMIGRPWEYVAIIRGFQDKVTAMQFEWAWQHVDKSRVFREAVGSDKDARKMKRRRGVIARLNDLRILLSDCPPFKTMPLEFHYLVRAYNEMLCTMTEEDECLNPSRFSQDDILLTTRDGVKNRNQIFNDVNQMMASSSPSVNQGLLIQRVRCEKSRRLINSRSCNTVVRMGARPKSNWALNAVSASNVQESISDDDKGANVLEQVAKTPSKFKPYPFTVSDVLLSYVIYYNFILMHMNYFYSIIRN